RRYGLLRDAERWGCLLGRLDHFLREPVTRRLPEQHLPHRGQRPAPLRGALTPEPIGPDSPGGHGTSGRTRAISRVARSTRPVADRDLSSATCRVRASCTTTSSRRTGGSTNRGSSTLTSRPHWGH